MAGGLYPRPAYVRDLGQMQSPLLGDAEFGNPAAESSLEVNELQVVGGEHVGVVHPVEPAPELGLLLSANRPGSAACPARHPVQGGVLASGCSLDFRR